VITGKQQMLAPSMTNLLRRGLGYERVPTADAEEAATDATAI
jgi:hypothetical protein